MTRHEADKPPEQPKHLPSAGAGAPRWGKPLAIAGFMVLAVGALAVVFVLPDAVRPTGQSVPDRAADVRVVIPEPSPRMPPDTTPDSSPGGPTENPAASPGNPPSSSDATSPPSPPVSAARREAEEARRDALRLQARLENAGARDWADTLFVTSFPEAMKALADANAAFEAADFSRASGAYGSATTKLRQLEENRPARLRRELEAAADALARLDTTAAETRFRSALVIDPGNSDAMAGLEAVKDLRRSIALSETGNAQLDAGDLEAALETFREAVAADAGYAPAQAGLDRAESEIAERDFGRAMTAAIAALDAQKFGAADRALAEANRVRPGDVAVRDLRQRLVVARQSLALRRLETAARKFEADEAWSKAVAAYKQALGIEATSGFAIAGLARAQKFEELHRQIDFYLDQPARLQSDKPAAHARTVLDAADGIAAAGRQLAEKRRRLAELLDAARSPVPVRIVSDGKTSVTVYRVARFGAFADRRVELVPGKYTAVGSRDGYRDVRVSFVVPLRSDGITIDVRCTEPI